MWDQAAPSAPPRRRADPVHLALLASALAVLVWSGLFPKSRFTWISEVFPAVIGGGLLVLTYRRFSRANCSCVRRPCVRRAGCWQYAVIFGGEEAEDFLGSQGDIWDTQKDMALALIGAITSLLVLLGLQQRQIDALAGRAGGRAAVSIPGRS